MLKAFHAPLLLALALLPGCVVQVPATTSATMAAYSYSWIEQVKVQVEPPAAGPRVASAPQSWHLIRLSVGRLDGSMPVQTKTINPFDSNQSRRVLSNLTPGDGYFIQASLIHQDGAGTEWEVARGQLGGDGESVRLNAGPNAVPIVMKPMVAGGIVNPNPTPLSRPSSRRSSGSFGSFGSSRSTAITIIETTAPSDWEPEEGDHYDDDAYDEAPDAETIHDWMDDEGDWTPPESSSEDDADDEESSWESDDSGDDTEDTGDWFGVSSALKTAR